VSSHSPRSSFSNRFLTALCAATLLMLLPAMATAAGPNADDDGDDGPAKPVTELTVTARRLDAARANIEPDTGASTYTLSNETVESRPGGETTNINQILLQAPGVLQDGSGRLHVRLSHGDLQYRINNVILPEGVSDLGESLSARMAQNVQLVTGALPAQYGFQAGGVVNVTTKNGAYLNGGQAELYGGSHGEFEPAFEYGTSHGPTNIFMSGSYRRNNVGLASPDGSARPLHDRTHQGEGFAFFDHILDPQTRVSAIIGISDDRFQIPNLRGLNAAAADPDAVFMGPLTVNGIQSYPSDSLDGTRREATRYGIASLMHATDHLTIQASAFLRQSILSEQANGIGDLLFRGFGTATHETNDGSGLQVESVYELAAAHTLRGGIVASWERSRTDAQSRALRIDSQGRQISDIPLVFADHGRLRTRKLSVFLQDEWRPTNDITLNLGVRADDVRSTQSARRLSPRAGAVWTLPGGAVLHIGYARYFLAPPHDAAAEKPIDLAGTSAAPPTLTGNAPGFETDDYYDVGLQWTLEDLMIGIDGYWRDARNLIAEGSFGPAHLDRVFSYDRAHIRGVELTTTYSRNALSAWFNLALAQGRGRGISGNQYYFTPAQLVSLAAHFAPLGLDQRYTASAGLSYHHGPLRLSGDMVYGSGLPQVRSGGIAASAHLPDHAQCNLAAVYRIASFEGRPLDMRMDITNVFDAHYILRDAGAPGSGLPQWGPRRGLFVGIEQAF
jgi:outer membrane cobalamin receptor